MAAALAWVALPLILHGLCLFDHGVCFCSLAAGDGIGADKSWPLVRIVYGAVQVMKRIGLQALGAVNELLCSHDVLLFCDGAGRGMGPAVAAIGASAVTHRSHAAVLLRVRSLLRACDH